ncbi:NUDIX hydrolase [Trypanosoma cruzi]|uniref:NUDIX hydrolase n=2 Tax=Trypanosoma cruzi TaxID=5693 RepID=V5B9P3_TRYCR|nr:NUDIX hydrolase [Trypanosoma cruzi Dm28c]PBJ77687.1 NUDIX hydrolase [Trypanosoma cruzi cruzi]PWU92206.1 putative NUDIX hydrolase 3 [Trypanosoma cruzi]RNF03096.1 NUDIX hydrolase [Trypanosoma cruzi]
MLKQYERTKLNVLRGERFLRLCEVSYRAVCRDPSLGGAEGIANIEDRTWEMVQRTFQASPERCSLKNAPFSVDGVEICALLRRPDNVFLILVAQYRPPVDAVVLEFPAGLVDNGEDVKSAALRELKEETGYVATEENIISVTDALCCEPGMTDSCCKFVRLFVDGEKEVNRFPQQELDEGEDIEVILLPISLKKGVAGGDTPLQSLNKLLHEKNKDQQRNIVDAKLYMFLDGLSQMNTMFC